MIALDELRADLRHALLAARDTAAIRQAIADAEAAEAQAAREAARRNAERVAAEEARLRRATEVIAAAAAERIAGIMSELEPPPAPLGAA
jgi:hypothetical protein